jgi:hypothetical protein
MDCFVAFAPGNDAAKTHRRILAARCVRAVASVSLDSRGRSATPKEGSRECRTLGASVAACAVVESTRVSHHGRAEIIRHSPRNGFNGLLRALLGDRAFLPPSLANKSANLTPASGRQDHTASPSARTSVFVNTPLASTASRSNVRDDRDTPLQGNGIARV